jgi:glycosyltransferase involved in cell wall biosynthesis
MASGLPVLGTCHPSSLVEDGVTGYASDDPDTLRARALELMASPEQAARLGTAAREMVRAHFSRATFARLFARAIEEARARWHRDACVAPGAVPTRAEE